MQPLFRAKGTDGLLWRRTLTAGWQQFGAPLSCNSGPAAAVVDSRLTVACRGLYNALWANSTATWSSGLPVFSTIGTSLGGVLAAAPAVASVLGSTTYFVLGTNGEIYIFAGERCLRGYPLALHRGQPAAQTLQRAARRCSPAKAATTRSGRLRALT